MIDKIIALTPSITLKDAWIALFVVVAIAAIEFGIIGGLATRVGSLAELLRLTASVADERSKKTANKSNETTNEVKE